MKSGLWIEKHWDANETSHEYGRRVYVSRGRWQWVVVVDDVADSAHDRKKDAQGRLDQIATERAAWVARQQGAR